VTNSWDRQHSIPHMKKICLRRPSWIKLNKVPKFKCVQENETHSHMKWKCIKVKGKHSQNFQIKLSFKRTKSLNVSQIFGSRFNGPKFIYIEFFLNHWKGLEEYYTMVGLHCQNRHKIKNYVKTMVIWIRQKCPKHFQMTTSVLHIQRMIWRGKSCSNKKNDMTLKK